MTAPMALALAMLLAGCQGVPWRSDEPVPPESVPVYEIGEPAQREPPVAVVLSADTSHYRSVADALGGGNWRRFVLTGSNDAQVLTALREARLRQAVAIGQQALTLLAGTELDVVYCQVFDAPPALLAGRRGVAALPEWGAQLDAWRRHRPDLQRVGVIVGAAHVPVVAALEAAALPRNLTVQHAVARSDRELLHLFRRMVPALDAFVLYPDTSILSPRAIRELLGYAAKHRVAVLTYNRPVFELGANLLMSVDPDEVARQVVRALDAPAFGGELPLSRVRLQPAVAPSEAAR